MKIALIGLPQAGKKTLFSLLTGRTVPESRKPGEVVEGIAPIRDERVDQLHALFSSKRTVYADNHFVLCPDAVSGSASRAWLDAARRCDLLCLVVRSFDSDQVYHASGSVHADRDEEELRTELLFADMELVEKRLARLEKEAKAGLSSQQKLEQSTLQYCMKQLESGVVLRDVELGQDGVNAIRSLGLLTMLPVLVVENVSEGQTEGEKGRLAVSCLIEQEIASMEDASERTEFLESLGLRESGLDRFNAAAYDAQGLMSFYTAGKDECRAWTIRKGSSAPVAGGKIHSDIERGFIRVEVIKYHDLMEAGSEAAAKEQGKMLTKGRDYVLEDGDVCHFLFNV